MTEDAQIVSIFARWRNLEDEKSRVSEDSKELFAEAKSNGFEPKSLRIAFREVVRMSQPVSDVDLTTHNLARVYVAALARVSRETA